MVTVCRLAMGRGNCALWYLVALGFRDGAPCKCLGAQWIVVFLHAWEVGGSILLGDFAFQMTG